MKKGALESGELVKLLIVAVVVGATIWLFFTSNFSDKISNLIPGLGGSKDLPEGVLIVKVDPTKNFEIEYNSVGGWISLDKYPDIVKLEGFSFSKKELQNSFRTYYFNTRESQSWFALDKEYRILHNLNLNNDGTVSALDELLPIFGVDRNEIKIGANGQLVDKNDIADYGKYVERIISWRDEMLQGGKCQKLLEVSVNGAKNKYEVRRPAKTDVFLVVDLSRRVDSVKSECVRGTPEEKKDLELVPMRIDFSVGDGQYYLSWDKETGSWKWSVTGVKNVDSDILGDFQNVLVVANEFYMKNFYNGFVALSESLSKSYGGLFGFGSDKPVISSIYIGTGDDSNSFVSIASLAQAGALNSQFEISNKGQFSDLIMKTYYSLTADTKVQEGLIGLPSTVKIDLRRVWNVDGNSYTDNHVIEWRSSENVEVRGWYLNGDRMRANIVYNLESYYPNVIYPVERGSAGSLIGSLPIERSFDEGLNDIINDFTSFDLGKKGDPEFFLTLTLNGKSYDLSADMKSCTLQTTGVKELECYYTLTDKMKNYYYGRK